MEIESSPASGNSKEEMDQIERSTKKAKRPWPGIEFDSGEEGGKSFVDVVIKGLHRESGEGSQGKGMVLTHLDEKVDCYEEEMEEEGSEWDTDSDDEESVEPVNELCPVITLSKEEKIRLRKPWSTSVIIKLVGMNMGYGALSRRLFALWKPSGTMDIIDVGNEFYIARFGAEFDYKKVMMEGPWIIADHYLWCKDGNRTSILIQLRSTA